MPATYLFTELLEIKGTSGDIQPDPFTLQKTEMKPQIGEELVQGPVLVSGIVGMKIQISELIFYVSCSFSLIFPF